ncbi:hypothetical protein SUGI_1112630 [Cryptomeria japonica]|nr:hypothetical protein SUGI_1112630 [Cryptomeria japonica]
MPPPPGLEGMGMPPSPSYTGASVGPLNYNPQSSSEWQERTARDGRRYIYYKRTRKSSSEKPLESMTPIEASTQWRKVQDRLEDDERCSRVDIKNRLEIFQEYICDLEKEEDEQKNQKENLRQRERKNRDEFRRLMEDHKASGLLTEKTQWLDYCAKVKNHPAYLAVASNTYGSPPKDLFEGFAEEMKKQYQEDKANIKDALKAGKFIVTSAWTLDKFKASIGEVYNLAAASETSLKLVFEEVLEQAKQKEEKEAKKRQRLADDFMDLLHSVKEIVASSKWEDCIPLLEDAQEYRFMLSLQHQNLPVKVVIELSLRC